MIREPVVERLLVVFDLDGTLVDSRRDIAVSANDTLERLGAPRLSDDDVAKFVGDGAKMLVARAMKASGLGVDRLPGALATFLEIYETRLLETTAPYAGISELIRGLSLARVQLGVITNKPQAPSERILAAFDLKKYFQWVIGGDTTWPRKPDPSSLQWMMTQAGRAPAETIFVGDTGIDAETARAAGTKFCLAAYGFGQERGVTELRGGEFRADAASDIFAAVDELGRAGR